MPQSKDTVSGHADQQRSNANTISRGALTLPAVTVVEQKGESKKEEEPLQLKSDKVKSFGSASPDPCPPYVPQTNAGANNSGSIIAFKPPMSIANKETVKDSPHTFTQFKKHDTPSTREIRAMEAFKPVQKQSAVLSKLVIQRTISEDQFIADTSYSFLCCHLWRTGDTQILNDFQEMLRNYEAARGNLKKLEKLKELHEKAQTTRPERGSKLYNVLLTLKEEVQQLIKKLEESPEYREIAEQQEHKKAEDEEAIEKESLGIEYSKATPDQRNTRLEEYKQKIPDLRYLLVNIQGNMKESDAIQTLLNNFFNRKDFSYTFNGSTPFTKQGDCQTLRNEFITIAREALGIQLEPGNQNNPVFVEGGGKIIDSNNLTGNVENGAHWLFENHHWVIWQGQPIDVLYGKFGVLQQSIEGAEMEKAPFYGYQFEGRKVYVAENKSRGNFYTENEQNAMKNPQGAQGL